MMKWYYDSTKLESMDELSSELYTLLVEWDPDEEEKETEKDDCDYIGLADLAQQTNNVYRSEHEADKTRNKQEKSYTTASEKPKNKNNINNQSNNIRNVIESNICEEAVNHQCSHNPETPEETDHEADQYKIDGRRVLSHKASLHANGQQTYQKHYKLRHSNDRIVENNYIVMNESPKNPKKKNASAFPICATNLKTHTHINEYNSAPKGNEILSQKEFMTPKKTTNNLRQTTIEFHYNSGNVEVNKSQLDVKIAILDANVIFQRLNFKDLNDSHISKQMCNTKIELENKNKNNEKHNVKQIELRSSFINNKQMPKINQKVIMPQHKRDICRVLTRSSSRLKMLQTQEALSLITEKDLTKRAGQKIVRKCPLNLDVQPNNGNANTSSSSSRRAKGSMIKEGIREASEFRKYLVDHGKQLNNGSKYIQSSLLSARKNNTKEQSCKINKQYPDNNEEEIDKSSKDAKSSLSKTQEKNTKTKYPKANDNRNYCVKYADKDDEDDKGNKQTKTDSPARRKNNFERENPKTIKKENDYEKKTNIPNVQLDRESKDTETSLPETRNTSWEKGDSKTNQEEANHSGKCIDKHDEQLSHKNKEINNSLPRKIEKYIKKKALKMEEDANYCEIYIETHDLELIYEDEKRYSNLPGQLEKDVKTEILEMVEEANYCEKSPDNHDEQLTCENEAANSSLPRKTEKDIKTENSKMIIEAKYNEKCTNNRQLDSENTVANSFLSGVTKNISRICEEYSASSDTNNSCLYIESSLKRKRDDEEIGPEKENKCSKIKSKDESNVCYICGAFVKRLAYHLVMMHDICFVTCAQCGLSVRNKKCLLRHLNYAHKERHNISCQHCEYQTNQMRHMKRHVQYHHTEPDKVFACEDCDYKTTRSANLKFHHRSHHTAKVTYKCESCAFETRWQSHLYNHVKSAHTNTKPKIHRCKHCDFSTRWPSHLYKHNKDKHSPHSDEPKVYPCKECNFAAKYQSYLYKHVKEKHRLKDVVKIRCEECSFETRWHSHYYKHKKTKHSKTNESPVVTRRLSSRNTIQTVTKTK